MRISQKGAVPIAFLLVAVGLLILIFLTNTFSFKDRLFGTLFPKPPSLAQTVTTKEMKVWVLQYIPPGGISSLYPGAEVMDPASFTKNTLLPSMSNASRYRGYSNSAAIAAISFNLQDSNIKLENNPPPLISTNNFDYAAPFTKYDLCNFAKNNDIKLVILWAAGSGTYQGGFAESAITGNKGIPTNGPMLTGPQFCDDKTILILGLNYERGLAEALESYGHHLEAVFRKFRLEYISWSDEDKPRNTNLWGQGDSCGNGHNPPNARCEYDRSNPYGWLTCGQSGAPSSVLSDCRDWKPDGSGVKENLDCSFWNCDKVHDGEYWLIWWMQNMPGLSNGLVDSSGKPIPSWWEYIADPDTFLGSGNFSNLLAQLTLNNANFSFDYSSYADYYEIDMSSSSNFSSDIFFKFVSGTASPIVETNPAKMSSYKCGVTMYWKIRAVFNSQTAQTSPIQSAVVNCATPSPTPSPTPPPQTGDINGDGCVNVLDFSILLSKWGTNDTGADLNKDGTVNIVDFSVLLSKWGNGCYMTYLCTGLDPNVAASGLQACIDLISSGGTLEIPAGTYTISTKIEINKSMTLRSQSTANAESCYHSRGTGGEGERSATPCATIRAASSYSQGGGTVPASGLNGFIHIQDASNVQLDHLIIDGNYSGRYSQESTNTNCTLVYAGGAFNNCGNIIFSNSPNSSFTNGAIIEGLANSAIVVANSPNFTFKYNTVRDNGRKVRLPRPSSFAWHSDGLQIVGTSMNNNDVEYNMFIDNTDGAISINYITQGTTIAHNSVLQRTEHIWSGIVIGTAGSASSVANDSGTTVWDNYVDGCHSGSCSSPVQGIDTLTNSYMVFGIIVGDHPWGAASPPVVGINIYDNSFVNANRGIQLDSAGSSGYTTRIGPNNNVAGTPPCRFRSGGLSGNQKRITAGMAWGADTDIQYVDKSGNAVAENSTLWFHNNDADDPPPPGCP